MEYYKELIKDEQYKKALENIDEELIKDLQEGINSKYSFREYQKKALNVFHFFNKISKDYTFKYKLYDEKYDNIPFYGFEMATGSGKTILLGSNILYLNKYNKIKNFLIITPNRTIYEKTIKNFDLNDIHCIFSNNLPFKFNLVTGDNYQDKSSNYEEDADFNIFVFNISKFFEKNSSIMNIDKPWEAGYWKHPKTNEVVSFREYLQLIDLAILTDESHHYQNFKVGNTNKSSGDIIVDLQPKLVIEYTATALSDEKERRNQKIVFKYSIEDYINEGFGKKVRALGIDSKFQQGLTEYDDNGNKLDDKVEIIEQDETKLVRALIVHLLKKKALKDTIKPVLLIRGRRIEHLENIYNYLKEVSYNEDLIKTTYQHMIKDKEFEINKLISEELTIEEIILGIEELIDKTFTIHSGNRDQVEVASKFNDIENNDQEVVIQYDIATEGWNIDNVYTILILSNTPGSIKTYIKQLTGRGLRLYKEKREFDNNENLMLQQKELLHMICEKGSNFKKFIDEVRQDLGLSVGNFSGDNEEKEILNDMTLSIEDISKNKDVKVPKIIINNELEINNIDDFLNRISYENLRIENFYDEVSNSSYSDGFEILLNEQIEQEERSFQEGDETKEKSDSNYKMATFYLTEPERSKIIKNIISGQNVLPSTIEINERLREIILKIEEHSFYYKEKDGYNARNDAVKKFINTLSRYIIRRVDTYYQSKCVINKYESIFEIFHKYKFKVIIDEENPRIIDKQTSISRWLSSFGAQKSKIKDYYITNYNKSYYLYNNFESSHELKVATILDNIEEIDFWINAKNQYYMDYGLGKRFYPDFFIKLRNSNKIYVVEVKGGHLQETTRSKDKIQALKEVNLIEPNKFEGLWLEDKTVDKMYEQTINTFNQFKNYNDLK